LFPFCSSYHHKTIRHQHTLRQVLLAIKPKRGNNSKRGFMFRLGEVYWYSASFAGRVYSQAKQTAMFYVV
jgi:hypothetical protein